MDLDKAIQGRHSVRKFSNKKADWRTIIECVDAMRYAPMAGGNYTLKIIIVYDEEKLKKIAEASQQKHVGEVRYVVVVCSVPSRTLSSFGEKGKIYCKQQAGAAIQNFLLKIEEAGLGTCWVGHFIEEDIKKVLKIPSEWDIEALFPVGHEYEKPRTRKAKIDMDRMLYFNYYDNKKMKKENLVE